MVNECASCGVDDELLFTCSYCSGVFCATHQFPHHGCEGFGQGGTAAETDDADEWLPASALEGESVESWEVEPTTETTESGTTAQARSERPSAAATDLTEADGGSPQPATVSPAEPSHRATSLSTGTWSSSSGVHRGAGDGVVNVRLMDSHRGVGGAEANAAPRTVGDWITRQTYLTLVLKIGIVALLVNSAFYGGMAVTMYGLLPFL